VREGYGTKGKRGEELCVRERRERGTLGSHRGRKMGLGEEFGWDGLANAIMFQVMKREKGTRCWRDLAEGQMAVNQTPFLLMDGLIFAANFKFSWNGVSIGAGHSKVVYKSTLQSSNSGKQWWGRGARPQFRGCGHGIAPALTFCS
jgi:hypothetical protein